MNQEDPSLVIQDENQIIAERRAKLSELRCAGNAFPNAFRREHLAEKLHQQFDQLSKEQLEVDVIAVKVAGRMVLKRVMGKASFATIQDMSGRIQLYISDDLTGASVHSAFKQYDLGDILGAHGTLFKTKTGELSIRVNHLELLTKSLRPLPEKFHGLTDQEQKYRQRYLDLITNEEARKTFITRSKVIQGIREFLVARDYLEVETPKPQKLCERARSWNSIRYLMELLKPLIHDWMDSPIYYHGNRCLAEKNKKQVIKNLSSFDLN